MIARCVPKVLAGLAGALVLSSCALLSEPPPLTYDLVAPPAASPARASTRAQILIPEPTAIRTLDSQQIVVKPTPYTLEYLGNSQWSDELPRVVQLRILQAFQNTGRVGAVGVPGQGLAIDYQIVMELRRFEISVAEGNAAIVEIAVKALNDRNGSVRDSEIFQARVPVSTAGNAGYVAALNTAFGRVTGEIVAWTVRLI